MASYIEIEMNDETLKFEYDRSAIIEMEKMGYNAINPTATVYTSYEIMVYGGLLKHQPSMTWKKAIEISEFMANEYGMLNVIQELTPMVNEVFHLDGKPGKKLVRKGIPKK